MSNKFHNDIALIRSSGLFDSDWYLSEYDDVRLIGADPIEHYLKFGIMLHRNPNPRFDTRAYLDHHRELIASGENPFVHYLRSGIAGMGSSKGLKEAEPTVLRSGSATAQQVTTAATTLDVGVAADPSHLIVYSCLFGNYDCIKEPKFPPRSGVRYLLFTDRTDLQSDRWEVIHVAESLGDLRRVSRLPKILSHVYLPPHELSLYLDSTLELREDFSIDQAHELLNGKDIALYPHYARNCTFDEIEHCVRNAIVDCQDVKDILNRFRSEAFPERYGLFENALIVRRNTGAIRRANAIWWDEFRRGPHRDQFYLMYVMWKLGIEATQISDSRNFRKSKYAKFSKHARYTKKPGALRISWILDDEAVKGWAYANNTSRLINALNFDDHQVNEIEDSTDIAVFFDALLYSRSKLRGRRNVLRLGGPRPLRRMFRGDVEDRTEFLSQFDALIALSPELERLGRTSGVPTYLVPNGLDLQEWGYIYAAEQDDFVVGFAANLTGSEERRLKGFDSLARACKSLGVRQLSVTKGEGTQIAHNRMREDFYSKISCLVHPVAEGKEGCSNTIMEALACGVPVITTRTCGYHSDLLRDNEDVLFTERDAESIARCISNLKDNLKARRRLSENGRQFAERHHDVRKIASEYRNVFLSIVKNTARVRVAFLPVRTPVDATASARLRCSYMVDTLNESIGSHVRGDIGLTENADVIVVSQLCTEKMLIALQERRIAGRKIVYDCCDPYFDRQEEVYGIHAAQRFWEIVDVAHLVTVPTEGMRQAMLNAGVAKPIVIIPDGIDYREQLQPSLVPETRSAVWFGNPGHGNIESGLWALRHLNDRWGYAITVITKPNKATARLGLLVEPWAFEGFVDRLRRHGMALISQDASVTYKSENRFVVSLANGVPAISTGSSSIARFLADIGFPEMNVSTPQELDRAMELLSDSQYRQNYVWQAQAYINIHFAGVFIARTFYESVLQPLFPKKPVSRAGRDDMAYPGLADLLSAR